MNREAVLATLMPTGLETRETGSQPRATYSRLQADLCHGGVGNKTLWLFQLQKQNMLHYPVLLRSVYGWEDSTPSWETHRKDLLPSWKITSRPLQWREIHSTMGGSSTLTLSIISPGSKSAVERLNWSTVPQTRCWPTCWLRGSLSSSSAYFKKRQEWHHWKLWTEPWVRRSVSIALMTLYCVFSHNMHYVLCIM